MRDQQGRLDQAFTRRPPTQVLEAVDLQSDAFEEREREEEPRLIAGEPAPEAGAVRRLPAGEDQHVGFDVGVLVDVVGVGVVPVVFVVPPAIAQAQQQIRVDESDRSAHRPVAGDLCVARVVAYEGRAAAQYGEHRCQEQHPPGVADQDDACDDGCQGERVAGNGERVPALPTVQESLAFDHAQEWGELTGGSDPGGRLRHDCGDFGHGGTPDL